MKRSILIFCSVILASLNLFSQTEKRAFELPKLTSKANKKPGKQGCCWIKVIFFTIDMTLT